MDTTRRLLINGWLVEAHHTFSSLNAATGEVVGHAPDADANLVVAAVAAARRAFDTTGWSTDGELRIRCLERLYQALAEHEDGLRELAIADAGTPRVLTHAAQLDDPIEIVRHYADLLRTQSLTGDPRVAEYQGARRHRRVEKDAAGVVVVIIPDGCSSQLALGELAPALAAGCTAVVKGAPDAPLVTLALGELIASATGIPPGVVNVLTSSDVAIDELLTSHADVDVVSVTCATTVGHRLSEISK